MLEEPFEDEAMAEVTPPVLARITGSTGLNSLQDGGIRLLIVGLPMAVVAFAHTEYGFLSPEGLSKVEGIMGLAGLGLWAVFDKFVKPRLSS